MILEQLYDRRDGYATHAELAELTGLNQAQIARALSRLREIGHEVEFSPSHGLRLARPVRLDAHIIERGLDTGRVGRNVICFEQVGSTNDVAFDSARQADADGLVVLAESQSKGRGRLGRKWVSPPQTNVLMSVLLVDAAGSLPHEAITIAAGLAAAEGIEQAVGLDCRLKWPNDLELDGEKLAGILVEVRNIPQARGPARRCVVVGIGVNCNAAPPADAIGRHATCLADHLGEPVERIEIVRAVLQSLDRWIADIAAGQLDDLHNRWVARCGMINRRVTILSDGVRHTGRVLDVQPLEGLVLCKDNGQTVHLPASSSTVGD